VAGVTRAAEPELREWVERLSMVLERDGLPRMAGRIYGWLLVCEPPEQSMEELAAGVQGSKASMSTMTRLLVQADLIEKVRRPGARRDVFRIRVGQWRRLWESRMQLLQETVVLTGRGLALLARRPPASRDRLEELHHQYRFMEEHLPALLARFDREHAAAHAGLPAARRGRAGSGRSGGARPAARSRRAEGNA
jgi:DNA-binding MarR family transcriptional regulator